MIVEDPHPALYEVSRPVTAEDFKDVRHLANKALKHLKKTKNGVGLAANQVGDTRRWFVSQTFKVVINPEIILVVGKKEAATEGCLSKPGFQTKVYRPSVLDVCWTSGKGKKIHKRLRGLPARIFQHELDHLNGIVIWRPRPPKNDKKDT
jgi:peptide deformylase